VIDQQRDADGAGWIRIQTGTEPNGASAWVRATDVHLVPMRERIVVDLSERRLRRYVNGELRDRLSVAVGSPSTPTVPGTYFVWARIRDYKPSIYGRFVLGLSGFSEVVNFGPTPGRLAIHGTADPSDKGRAVSLGCVRVLNQELTPLWRVPMGTPVVIRP
jgi:lipoprotein-anchoring transpeptidase ErfK/SrfK